MKNYVWYEYACEYVSTDDYEDIEDSDFSEVATECWPPRYLDEFPDCKARLVAIRHWGNDHDAGDLERGYAYRGDTHFDTGHKVPQYMLKQLAQSDDLI